MLKLRDMSASSRRKATPDVSVDIEGYRVWRQAQGKTDELIRYHDRLQATSQCEF